MIAALLALVFVSSSHIPADTPTVKNVSWMLGCWVTEPGETTSWESWVKATDHEMYGMSYTVDKAGAVRQFEFLRIRVVDVSLAYLAQPNGNPVTVFTLTASENGREAVFANPEHDFPKRVGYRATQNGLLAWIDGGPNTGGRRIEFPMTRTTCDRAQ